MMAVDKYVKMLNYEYWSCSVAFQTEDYLEKLEYHSERKQWTLVPTKKDIMSCSPGIGKEVSEYPPKRDTKILVKSQNRKSWVS